MSGSGSNELSAFPIKFHRKARCSLLKGGHGALSAALKAPLLFSPPLSLHLVATAVFASPPPCDTEPLYPTQEEKVLEARKLSGQSSKRFYSGQ